MKTKLNSKNIIALLLAIVMTMTLAACGASPTADLNDVNVGDEITAPDANSWFDRYYGDKDDEDSDDDNATPTTKPSKKTPEGSLKARGEIITVVKSVSKPTAADPKAVQDTQYGTVNWSTAAQGYITFTAKGQLRDFVLQGPNNAMSTMNVQKGETIKIALTDGAGKYQYAIANPSKDNKTYTIQYKNSFTVKTVDSDLAPYLVSTPWGDYANAPNASEKAAELWDTKKTQLQNVAAIADWVGDLKYDKKLKAGSINVYVDPDKVIENGGGVCSDLSKLLVAMLRSQGIPAYYQSGLNAQGKSHGWVVAWVELEEFTKDGVTYSKGAWITIEGTSGSVQPLKSAQSNYTVGDYRN